MLIQSVILKRYVKRLLRTLSKYKECNLVSMTNNNWFIYIIRCKNNSLYTGITTDVERRFNEHCNGEGAKFLRGKGPLKLEFHTKIGNRSDASKIEYFVKKLSKQEKENIIKKGISNLLPLS